MYCFKCGNQLPEGVRFCTKCGAQVIVPTHGARANGPAANMAGFGAPAAAPIENGKKRRRGKRLPLIIAAVCVIVAGAVLYNNAAQRANAERTTTVTDHYEYDGISYPLTDCFSVESGKSASGPVITVTNKGESAELYLKSENYSGSHDFEDSDLVAELYPESYGNILSYKDFGDSAGLTWRKARLLDGQGTKTVYIGKKSGSNYLRIAEVDCSGSSLTDLTDAMIEGAEAIESGDASRDTETLSSAEETSAEETPAEDAAAEAPSSAIFCNSDAWSSANDHVGAYFDSQTIATKAFTHYEDDTGTYYIVLIPAERITDASAQTIGRALIGQVEPDLSGTGVDCMVVYVDSDYDITATYDNTEGLQVSADLVWYNMSDHAAWWA